MIRNPKPITTPTMTAVDFRIFIQHATVEDIDKFLELASTTRDGRNLALFWERAYDRGYAEGREDVLGEELELGTQELERKWMLQGQAVGYEEGYKKGKEDLDVKAIRTAAFEKGCCVGEVKERSLWEKGGHRLTRKCTTANLTPTSDVSVQSETLPSPLLVSSSAQTEALLTLPDSSPVPISEPPIPATVDLAPFIWADDTFSTLPIIPSKLPRDLSSLRSSTKNPFASLRRRHHYPKRPQIFSSCRHTYLYPTHPTLHHTPPLPNYPLDWHCDPCLFELSRVLRTLGWSHP